MAAQQPAGGARLAGSARHAGDCRATGQRPRTLPSRRVSASALRPFWLDTDKYYIRTKVNGELNPIESDEMAL
eukprot:832142-Pyramimonas_sp.AAC.2